MPGPRKRTLPGGNLVLTKLAERPQIEFEIDFFEELLRRRPDYADALAVHAANLRDKGQLRDSLKLDQKLVELRPSDPKARYVLACLYSVLGQRDLAVQCLKRAVELGWHDFTAMAHEADLSSLREDPRFAELLRRG